MEAFIERLAAVQAKNAEPEQAEEPEPDPVSAPSDTRRLKEGLPEWRLASLPSRLPLANVPHRGAARRVAYRTPELR